MSNYNKITYKGRTILDDDIAIGGGLTNNMMLYQALISEELKPDTFVFNLIYDKNRILLLRDSNGKYLKTSDGKFLAVRADDFDPENMTFGDPLMYYVDNGSTPMGKWYVRTVRRVQKKIYRFECMSEIGLLTYRGHNGGIYNGSTVGAVISDIMGDLPYYIHPLLSTVSLNGWLPKVNAARDNLRTVLFMCGAIAVTAFDGTVYFTYPSSGSPTQLDEVDISIGGSVSQLEQATRVEVTAHEFKALGTEDTRVLFDNTTTQVSVMNQLITFDGPYHSLDFDTLVEVESGVNYAIVSGIGTLTGKPYTHSTMVYGIDTGISSEPNVITVTDNYLVTINNVVNVARRVAGYYGVAKEVNYTMRLHNEKPGDYVTFTDPFGETQTGHIKSMNVTLSKHLNAAATIALNWTPGPFGDSYTMGSEYTRSNIVNGRLTLDADMVGKQAMIMLFSGAGGGQAGFDGEDGQAPNTLDDYNNETIALGGAGGEGGAPGERGKVFMFFVNSLPAYYDSVVIGEGGAGGASNGALGQPGGETSIGAYSTADGTQLNAEFTGYSVYPLGVMGDYGKAGLSGGIGSGRNPDVPDLSTDGESFVHHEHYYDHQRQRWVDRDVVDYAGGTHANPVMTVTSQKSSLSGGAGGGGAAWGNDGEDGASGYDGYKSKGGDGGDGGARGTTRVTWTGEGGYGGGGGGGAFCGWSKGSSQTGFSYGGNTGGSGGKGGAGGKGGDGCIIIRYDPQT